MHAPLDKLPALPSPQRSRSRRERRRAARAPVLHVVMPGVEIARQAPRANETVTAFLRRTGWAKRDRQYGWQFARGLPTVLEVNGEAVLRKRWASTRFAANDNVRFVSYPLGGQGGNAKQVIGLVALLAVSAFAAWAPAALFGMTAGSFAALGTTAAIGLGGALLVNALVAPKAGATNDPAATQDQIYTVQAQGNLAKLGQPLPVRYGRLKRYPDFAATPWGEFVGNDQYLNILLSMGMGSFEHETIYVSDTPMWTSGSGVLPAFSSAQVAFYEPGQNIDLFPINVSQSDEVSGQQLPHGSGWDAVGGDVFTPGAWLGGFVANPSGTLANYIAIDFVLPAGGFATEENKSETVPIRLGLDAEYRAVDDVGSPVGPWVGLFSVERVYANRSPIRDGVKVQVPLGRYEVRLRRNNGVPPDNRGASEIVWAGLRAFLQGDTTFNDVSTIAIRIKASESTQGSYKFGVLGTRKLPVWHSDLGAFVTEPTRNNAWAFLDAVTNPQYGSGHPISKTDFNKVVSFAVGCASRGDFFDYDFSSAVAVPEAFDRILAPARAKHFWLGDTVSIVRDEWQDVPSMLLTDREIVRDSTQVTFTMLGEDDPDAVVVEYLDQTTWQIASVQYPPDSEVFTATNAEVKRVDGIVSRDHAYRECAFYYLQSIYRRENVQVGVEYEGRALTFGQTLRIQSELPMSYGQGGAVINRSLNALTLNPTPSWATPGPYFIRLRRPNGRWFGPVTVTRGGSDAIANLNSGDLASVEAAQGVSLANVLLRDDGGEYPSYELGTAENQSRVVKLLSGVPNGNTCTLTLVVDDIRVHGTDLGSPPVIPPGQFPVNQIMPLIVGLNAKVEQGSLEPILSASWFPSPGAVYYIADVSFDNGGIWTQVYEGQDNKFDSVVPLGALTLRVQAVTQLMRGPYSTVELEAPTIALPPESVSYNSLDAGIKYLVTETFGAVSENLDNLEQRFSKLLQQATSRTQLDKKEIRSQLEARSENALARIEEVRLVAVDAEAAVASLETTVEAEFAGVNATITEHSTAIATLDGYAAGTWGVAIDVNGNVTGIVLANDSENFSVFSVTANNFRVAFPGATGGDAIPVFQISNVGGVPKIVFRGDMVGDGSILTQMIQAGAITTIKLAAQAVTADKIAAGHITSDSGVIGHLGVKSLSIGDNAVTVPKVQTIGSQYSNPFAEWTTTGNSLTLDIDTTGLAGKEITVYATETCSIGNIGNGSQFIYGYLYINGALVMNSQHTSGTGVTGTCTLAGAYTLIGTGGVVSIPVRFDVSGGTGVAIFNRVLFAMAVKR